MSGITREHKLLGVAVAMMVFIISLLLDWVGVSTVLGDSGSPATESNSWWIVLALAVVAGLLAGAEALNVPPPMRWAGVGLIAGCAGLACFWAITRFVDATEGPLNPQMGAWIGVIASAVGAALAISVWNRERP